MRLDKYLADMGRGTRSELKKIIRKGRVTVDGLIIKDPAFSVTPQSEVTLDGAAIRYEAMVYIMLNKPAGVVSATKDPRERTVLDLLGGSDGTAAWDRSADSDEAAAPARPDGFGLRRDLFPVGRLDKDTEGLLLLTNDGELAHRLLSPKRHVDKTYLAVLDREIGEHEIRLFAEGLIIDDEEPFTALPAALRPLDKAETQFYDDVSIPSDVPGGARVLVTIQEGKYHQVKRMFAVTGRQVLYLKRLSMGPLQLDKSLKSGEWRPLTEGEIRALETL